MEKEYVSLNKKERLRAFYKGQMFADCIFNISGAEVKAHKLILACSSPVFEKMFFGNMSSNTVEICDINLEDFEQVLEFIYMENISILSVQNAWALYYIANKYLLEDLMQVCLAYIQRNVTMSTLVLSYEYAEMYNLPDIKKKCFMDIVNYFSGAISSDYHMKPSTLSLALEKINPVFDKFGLTVEILNWAVIECDIREIPIEADNITTILNEANVTRIIKLDWIKNYLCSDCDNSLVLCECVNEIIHRTVLRLDKLLSWEKQPYNLNNIPNTCRFRKEFKIANRLDLFTNDEFVSTITTNRRLILFGVLVTTLMNPAKVDTKQDVYNGSVTVRICRQNSNVDIVKPTTVRGDLYYESQKYLPLKELPTLEPNFCYDLRISYKNHAYAGVTTLHTCYMFNELFNKGDDSVVAFHEVNGTLVKGLSFYAA